MIITLASLKGGSGKSCISIHLAHSIALSKKKCCWLTLTHKAVHRIGAAARDDVAPFVIVGMARDTLHRDLPKLVTDYNHAVIDTPPRVSSLARSAILAADLVLIPVQPSSFDIWAASETVDLVKEAQQFKDSISAAFVVNRKISNSAIGREVVEALQDYPFPVLKTAITQRVAFAESSAGYTVIETAPKSAAADEIKALSKDILKLMGLRSW